MILIGFITWVVSVFKSDVSIVDSMWSILILSGGGIYMTMLAPKAGLREIIVMLLLIFWALRLTIYITHRNWGEPEDYRYQNIRARNQPNFKWKSLYLVFIFQSILAWTISISLVPIFSTQSSFGWLDITGLAIVLFGITFETIGDWQLASFKKNPANIGQVMNAGLWRYTRHPNYFGEFCVWWGFYLISCSTGGWWTIFSPLLMSILLIRISGVALLEKDITERRPAYREYINRTSAFFPWFPKINP
jgi:steroid 5-alpha reductase family enzyme